MSDFGWLMLALSVYFIADAVVRWKHGDKND